MLSTSCVYAALGCRPARATSEGSAMNNASPGQQVRVKTPNGQVISGIVKDGATVEIQL